MSFCLYSCWVIFIVLLGDYFSVFLVVIWSEEEMNGVGGVLVFLLLM